MTWLLIAIILVLLASFLTLFAYFVAFYSSPRRAERTPISCRPESSTSRAVS